MSRLRAALRIARFTRTALEAVGRARMTPAELPERARRLHEACAEIAQIHGLRLAVRGALPAGPAVLVANHVGYLDVIAIAAVRACVPIAKSEIATWPIIGGASRGLGTIFVERDAPLARVRALRQAKAAVEAGVAVLNFPEGTTTNGRRLLPFHRGIFGIARLAGVPVIPIAIRCAPEIAWHGDAPFVPHYLRTSMSDPELRLDIGAPIDPAQFSSADELALVAHHRIAYLLRDHLEPHAPITRVRVPTSRAHPILPAPHRAVAR